MNSLHHCKYTRYWGKILYYFREINSTHTYTLLQVSKSSPQPGTVILADYQTQGRGQYGRSWVSEEGKNLMFSSVIYPEFLKPDQSFYLNLLTSVALFKVVSAYASSKMTSIKWPNDILIDGRKIAGILTQTSMKNNRIDHAVISIGLNVNQNFFNANNLNATSLCAETGVEVHRQEVFDSLCIELEQNLAVLRHSGAHELLPTYEKNLHGLNDQVRLNTAEESLEGICCGVDHRGRIIIQKADGSHHYGNSGSLEFL